MSFKKSLPYIILWTFLIGLSFYPLVKDLIISVYFKNQQQTAQGQTNYDKFVNQNFFIANFLQYFEESD